MSKNNIITFHKSSNVFKELYTHLPRYITILKDICPICLEHFKYPFISKLLFPLFCKNCISICQKMNSRCPLCRKRFHSIKPVFNLRKYKKKK